MSVRTAVVATAAVVASLLVPFGTATAVDDGIIDIAPSPLDFGGVSIGSTSVAYVTVTNTYGSTVTVAPTNIDVIPAPFASAAEDDGGTAREQTCFAHDVNQGYFQTPIDPGQSCRLYFSFSPTVTGPATADVPLAVYEQFGSPIEHTSLTLDGSGSSGVPATVGGIGVNPTSVAFGTVDVGDSLEQLITVTNTSNGDAQVHADLPTNPAFGLSSDPAGRCFDNGQAIVLAPQNSCVVRLVFTPTKSGRNASSMALWVSPSTGDPGETAPYSSSTRLASKTVSMSGTGKAQTYRLSATSLSFGKVTVHYSKTLAIKATNTSPNPLAFVLDSPSSDFVVLGPVADGQSCSVTGPTRALVVGQGASCSLNVAFLPSQEKGVASTLTLRVRRTGSWQVGDYVAPSNLGAVVATKSIKASGTGTAATVSTSPTSLKFGSVNYGLSASEPRPNSKTLTFKVTNTSDAPMVYLLSSDDDEFSVVPGFSTGVDCSTPAGSLQLAPGKHCTFRVQFAPTAVGFFSSSLVIEGHLGLDGFNGFYVLAPQPAVEVTKLVPVTGSGTAPETTVAPTPLSFGSVTYGLSPSGSTYNSKTLELKVTNDSDVPVIYTLASDIPEFAVVPGVTGDGVDCLTSAGFLQLGPGSHCVFTVTFRPSAVSGFTTFLDLDARPGIVGFTGHYLFPPLEVVSTSSVPVSGSGKAPTMTVSPTSLSFGSVTYGLAASGSSYNSKTLALTVTNTSDVPVVYFPSSIEPAFAVVAGGPADGTGCVSTDGFLQVAPGGHCVLRVRFTPTAVAAFSGTLTIEVRSGIVGFTGDYVIFPMPGAVASKSIAEKGTGAAPTLSVSPSSLSFGSVPFGGSKTLTLTVKNTSDVAVSYTLASPEDEFTAVGGAADGLECFSADGYLQVAPGGQCRFRVRFTPSSVGSFAATLHVVSHLGLAGFTGDYLFFPPLEAVATKQVPAKGSGQAVTYKWSPTTLAFGNVPVGSSKILTLTVTNTSEIPLLFELTSPSASYTVIRGERAAGICEAGNPDSLLVVRAGGTCTIRVRYSPTAVGTSDQAKLRLAARQVVNGVDGDYVTGTDIGPTLAIKTVNSSGKGV